MNGKRFVPCAGLLLLLLGSGGQVLGHEAGAPTSHFVAAFYICAGLTIIFLRGRIAALWGSSILLPVGCAAMLVLAGLSALSQTAGPQTLPAATNSAGVGVTRPGRDPVL